MTVKHLWLLGLLFFLAACGTPEATTPGPTPEVIKVYYPAALQPWADKLSVCAGSNSQIAVFFMQSENPASSLSRHDIVLEMGNQIEIGASTYAAQVGWEQVVVLVNGANPLLQVSSDKLEQIFSGKVLDWESGSNQLIHVWVLPEGETTRQIFDNALGLTKPLAPEALLAPDPVAMLKAVSQDESAIGYLPQSFLSKNGSVKILQLEPSLQQALRQPVIAITQGEPSGQARSLLACLQTTNP